MIAVISHDAGGAEILSSYVKRHDRDYIYVLEGPARKIFERKLGTVNVSDLEEAIRQSTSILCGTSWQSNIELDAIKLARALGRRSMAFLDHWVNYKERFSRSGEAFLPDEVWVGDAMAETMAKKTFPALPVKLVDNPYVQDILYELNEAQKRCVSSAGEGTALYVCEPLSEHALKQHGDTHFWGYVEQDALRYFLSNTSALGKSLVRILIRPHPSESAGKYEWACDEFDLPIEISEGKSLLEEVVDSEFVVGCESMAMVVALLAGKKVISCVPPGGRPCVLPHNEIINLQDLV